MGTFLWLFCVLVTGSSEIKQSSPIANKFRYVVVGTSLLAIASDGLVEYYYQKYQDEDDPGWCEKYRERTQLCEKIRDVSVWSVGVSLLGYVVSEKIAHKSKAQGFLNKLDFKFTDKKVELKIHYEI